MGEDAVLATNHVSFTVSDVQRSVDYFRDAYGLVPLSVGPRDPTAIRMVTGVADADILVGYLQAPNTRVELIQYLAPPARDSHSPRPCDVGFAHIAFDVTEFDSIIAAAARYGAVPVGGIARIDRGPNQGRRVVYLRDRDGVTVELVERAVAP